MESLLIRSRGLNALLIHGRHRRPDAGNFASANTQSSSDGATLVGVDNFIRAESDLYMGKRVASGGFGRFVHSREPVPIDAQDVIRMNRDTLYSSAVFDLDAGPVTITLPEAGERFMSMQVVNEDHYVTAVVYGAGRHTLTKEDIGTRYIFVAVRMFFDPTDREDLEQVHGLQDAIKVSQAKPGAFAVPKWDQASQKRCVMPWRFLVRRFPTTTSPLALKVGSIRSTT